MMFSFRILHCYSNAANCEFVDRELIDLEVKTVIEINSVNYFSTGKIMNQVAELGRAQGFHIITSCPRSRSTQAHDIDHQILFGDRLTRNLHLTLARYTGFNGCFSVIATLRFLHHLDCLHPALIHLHNLHNCYINIPLLFRYIKRNTFRWSGLFMIAGLSQGSVHILSAATVTAGKQAAALARSIINTIPRPM